MVRMDDDCSDITGQTPLSDFKKQLIRYMSYVKHINQLIESNRPNDPVGEKEFAHTT